MVVVDLNYIIRYLYDNKQRNKKEVRQILKHILPKNKVPNKKVIQMKNFKLTFRK